MPFLDARALDLDAEGMAFLAGVLRSAGRAARTGPPVRKAVRRRPEPAVARVEASPATTPSPPLVPA